MGMRRAHEGGEIRPGRRQIVNITSAAGDKALILDPADTDAYALRVPVQGSGVRQGLRHGGWSRVRISAGRHLGPPLRPAPGIESSLQHIPQPAAL
jgi:hypothetical protein